MIDEEVSLRNELKYAFLSVLLCFALLLSNANHVFFVAAQGVTQDFEILSESAVLINADTMEVLYAKNENARMYPASTTKMLSALLVAENLKLADIITAPANYKNPDPEGSNIAIDQNEKLSVEQLLNASLVASANDAIDILSRNVDFGSKSFVEVMNKRAYELGAINTHFVNPHGLHSPEHYTTAKDLAIIGAEVMKNPLIREIVIKPEYIIPPTNKKKEERNYLKTTNWFIRDNGNTMDFRGAAIRVKDENIIGIKTGYTEEAGYCLVSEIEVDNRHFIAVVLNSPNRLQSYVDSKNLLYYGLENFKFQNIVSKDEPVVNVKLEQFQNVNLPLVASSRIAKSMPLDFDRAKLDIKIDYFNLDSKEIERDMVLGKAGYYYNGELLGEVDLLASYGVRETDFISELTTAFSSQSKSSYIIKHLGIPLVKLVIAVLIWWLIIKWKRRRKNRKGIDFKKYK